MAKITPLFNDHMNDHTFTQMVRQIAQDSGAVKLTIHAIERMEERSITRKQVIDTLRRGFLVEPVSKDAHGDWAGRMSHTSAGERITVVSKLKKQNGNYIVVITTY